MENIEVTELDTQSIHSSGDEEPVVLVPSTDSSDEDESSRSNYIQMTRSLHNIRKRSRPDGPTDDLLAKAEEKLVNAIFHISSSLDKMVNNQSEIIQSLTCISNKIDLLIKSVQTSGTDELRSPQKVKTKTNQIIDNDPLSENADDAQTENAGNDLSNGQSKSKKKSPEKNKNPNTKNTPARKLPTRKTK